MSIQQKMEDVLKNEVRSIGAEVIGSMVVEMGGLPLASDLPSGQDEDQLAGIIAAFIGAAEKLADDLLQESSEQVYIKSHGKYVILNTIGQNAVLAVMATEKAKLGLIFYWLREKTIPKLKSILGIK